MTYYLDGQFWFKDENSISLLIIIRLKLQIYYQEYLKYQNLLENIELEKNNLQGNIEKAKPELRINNENFVIFKMKVNQLKQFYEIQPYYPEIDIAILYSHPLVKQNEIFVSPVQQGYLLQTKKLYKVLFEFDLDSNFYKIQLKDWVNNSDKKEKCDYYKFLNEYGDELTEKIIETVGERQNKVTKI